MDLGTLLFMVLFLLGSVGAFGSVPVALAVVLNVRCRPRLVWLGKVLALIVGGGWLGYWILWQVSFGYLDAYRPVPLYVEVPEYAAMVVSAVGSIGLLVIAVTALPSRIQASR